MLVAPKGSRSVRHKFGKIATVIATVVATLFGTIAATESVASAAVTCGSTGSYSSGTSTCTYSATGADYYTVGTGVTQVTFDVYGAQGGGGNANGNGGNGGEAKATLAVTPGETFEVTVGSAGGAGAYAGGGGGGASDIRTGTCAATLSCVLTDRQVVAGGGGGGGGWGYYSEHGSILAGNGGAGSGGSTGQNAATVVIPGGYPIYGGGGGTSSAGGSGGASPSFGAPGSSGSLGSGGAGGGNYAPGGSGGSGYYGGGGGGGGATGSGSATDAAGGGGGSGYITPSAIVALNATGVESGNGKVLITATTSMAVSAAATSTYGQSVTYTATVTPSDATGTVQFAVDGTNIGSAQSVSGGVATLSMGAIAVGNHSVRAIFIPNSGFAGSSGTLAGGETVGQATLAVTPNAQTITYGEADPTFTYSISGYQNRETSSVLTTLPICGVTGSHTAAGNYTIACTGGSSANYVINDAPTAQFTVGKGAQTISFTSSASSATVGGSYTPTASSTSLFAVTIKVDTGSSSVCSINGSGVVSFLTSGTCTLDATQAGDANHLAATPVQQSVTVSAAPNGGGSSGLTSQAPLTLASTRGVVGTPLTLTTSGGAGTGALTYLLSSAGSAKCTLNGDTLVATSAGTCTLLVTKAGDATYLAAISSPTTVSFTSATLTQAPLTLTSTRGVVGTPLTLTTSGGSGTGVVTYALSGPGTATCTLSGDTLTATRAGTCTLLVTKVGDPTYAASSSAATVTFDARLIATRVTGDVEVGRTSLVTISGTGFYDKPTIRSNDARTSAVVIHDHGTALVVRVEVRSGAPTGWHDFTITLADGHSCRVRYLVKAGLSATRVEGSVRVGTTSIVTIIGTGFYDKPTIRSNDAHTSAVVIHDHGTSLVVRVEVRHGAATGWHDFTITLANGRSCRVRYLVK